MTVQNCIPFLPTAWTTELAGLSLGQKFLDPRTGYQYKLIQVAETLTNDELRNGEVLSYSDITNYIATNDISAAEAVDTNYVKPAGVVDTTSAIDIPESSATVTRYALVLVRGRKTIVTDGGDDITAGDTLIIDPTVDGACDSIDTDEDIGTTALNVGDWMEIIGRSVDADDDTANTVVAEIDIKD